MNFEELGKINQSENVAKTEKSQEPDIKNYVDHAWRTGYFDDLKKVLG